MMTSDMTTSLWMALVPAIAAPLNTLLVQMLKRASTWYAVQSDTTKRAVATVLGLVITLIGFYFPSLHLPTDWHQWSAETLLGALAGLGSIGFYHLFHPVPATPPVTSLADTTTSEIPPRYS